MLKIVMKISFLPQTFVSNFFFQDQHYNQCQDFSMKLNNKKLCFKY